MQNKYHLNLNNHFEDKIPSYYNISYPIITSRSKVRKFEENIYDSNEINIGIRFFQKSVFEAVGSFDESLIACKGSGYMLTVV